MTTSKPKQPLVHALANSDHTSDACDGSNHNASVAGDPQGACTPPDMSCDLGDPIARVTAVDRDQYLIRHAESEVPAKLTGRAAYTSESPADMPCVGDWVHVKYYDSGAHASILDVLPRKSFLRRKRPGDDVEFQMIAANIDVAFIVC